jgi:hypothetical protein
MRLQELCKNKEGRPISVDLDSFILMTQDADGKLVEMQIDGRAVHVDQNTADFCTGYSNPEGVADLVCPVKLRRNKSGVFFQWSRNDIFQPMLGAHTGDGEVQELPINVARANFATRGYFYGSFISTEVEANADAPLRPYHQAARVCLAKASLDRELRVQALLGNPANYATAAQRRDLAALSKQWYIVGTGAIPANSDPVADLHNMCENSVLPITHLVFPEPIYNAFCRHPVVKSYIQYKDGIAPVEDANALSALLKLPKILIAKMKAATATSDTPSYIWGNNVVGVRVVDAALLGQDAGTAYTHRWTVVSEGDSGRAPGEDGAISGGMISRTFFVKERGGLGGQKVVVGMYDQESMTAPDVGGILTNVLG